MCFFHLGDKRHLGKTNNQTTTKQKGFEIALYRVFRHKSACFWSRRVLVCITPVFNLGSRKPTLSLIRSWFCDKQRSGVRVLNWIHMRTWVRGGELDTGCADTVITAQDRFTDAVRGNCWGLSPVSSTAPPRCRWPGRRSGDDRTPASPLPDASVWLWHLFALRGGSELNISAEAGAQELFITLNIYFSSL